MVIEFKDWLFSKFQEWEHAQPKRRMSFASFARFLSNNSFDVKITQQVIDAWINGRYKPGRKYAPVLAEKLGIEVYDYLDLEPPDPMLLYISANWERLPPNIQHAISDQITEYLAAQGEDHATNDAAYQP